MGGAHVHQPGVEPVNATTEDAALADPVVYSEYGGDDEFEVYTGDFYRQVALDTLRRLNGPLYTQLQELRHLYHTASQQFVAFGEMGRQIQSMSGWLRHLAGRRYLFDEYFAWPGPRWHQLVPL